MTIKVQNLSDLQDRRIMMEKKLPPYGYAFVILVGIFMLFLVVWSTHTNRIYVSQNAGTVQASNKNLYHVQLFRLHYRDVYFGGQLCERGRPRGPHQEHGYRHAAG